MLRFRPCQCALDGLGNIIKKQETINIAAWADGGTLPKIQHNPADSLNIPSSYDYKYYTVFDKNLTMGDIRGHYWKDYGNLSYSEGCANGHYLKKKAMDNAKKTLDSAKRSLDSEKEKKELELLKIKYQILLK